MDPVTEALHVRVSNDGVGPAVTPVYRSSAFTADSPYFYTRKNNPNVAELEQVLCVLEGARFAIAVSSGMAAIYLTFEFVQPGDVVVLNQDVYGCTFKLFERLSARRGFELDVVDLSEDSGRASIRPGTRMVFFETPTNPFLKSVDIAAVADRAKTVSPRALVVVDNTWATSLFQRPLEWGADISLHSGTKYFSGHSDVLNGALLADREDVAEELRQMRFYGGAVLEPDAAWLVRRSLQTLELRLRHQQAVTSHMRDFLQSMPEVSEVYYPQVDGRQLTGYGGILFFRLRGDLAYRYDDFAKALRLFGTGTAMAAVTSMVAQPYTGSHASMSAADKAAIGLGEDLVRLCFGLEDENELKQDLLEAFRTLSA